MPIDAIEFTGVTVPAPRHIRRYMATEGRTQRRTARVGRNNRAQVVTIPLEFRFPEGMKEVFIRKVGEDVVLSPRPVDWSGFLASNLKVEEDFMAGVEDLPP
jgi:antitoxin VapB